MFSQSYTIRFFALAFLPGFLFNHVQAQHSRQKPSEFSSFEIGLPDKAPSDTYNPSFNQVKILDLRSDTTKLGYLNAGTFKKIVVKNGIEKALEKYLNNQKNAPDSTLKPDLLIIIKNLWMQEIKAGEKYDNKYSTEIQPISECIVKLELYAVRDRAYQALIRIDSTFTNTKPIKLIASEFLMLPFQYTFQKLQSVNVSDLLEHKRKINETEITNYYNKQLQYPRIKNDLLQKGIFLSFDDFMNNKITEKNFTLEQDDEADYMYIEENGEKKLFTDFWGFCDGKQHFIRVGYNFFPLSREQNTYFFWGCEQAVHKSKPRSSNRAGRYMLLGVWGELHNTRLVNFLRPMQINMETGKAL